MLKFGEEDIAMGPTPKKPRPNEFIRVYFEYNKDSDVSVCKIDGCSGAIKSRHTTNLERHIQSKHPVQYGVIISKRIQLENTKKSCRVARNTFKHQTITSNIHSSEESTTLDSHDCETSSSTSVYSSGKKKSQQPTISIPMDENTVVDALVEMVTINGRPYSAVEDSGLGKLLKPIMQGLRNQQGSKLVVNRHNIKHHVQVEAINIKEDIKKDVAGKMVCLKVDAATRLDRSVLGINLQICKNGRISLRNLAVKQLYYRHTAENLKDKLMAVLAEYNIRLEQIYSITTDNGSNMVKSVKLLAEEDEYSGHPVDEDTDQLVSQQSEEYTLQESLQTAAGLLLNEQVEPTENFKIIGQRCAAHTLQLAVWDGLKNFENEVLVQIV